MKVIEQDITTVDMGIVGHQCNCRGAMGSGVALAIRNKWPKAYEDYRVAYEYHRLILGMSVMSEVSEEPPLFVAHLCGQWDYGKRGIFTNYNALSDALCNMRNFQEDYARVYDGKVLQLYLPYGIGCGLAGGDWKKVEPIIESIMPDVILCKWGG